MEVIGMIKLNNKIISSIVGIAIAGGAITVTAATAQPKVLRQSTVPVSSTVSSEIVVSSESANSVATVLSEGTVSNVADGVDAINKATQEGVSAVNKATQDGIQTVKDQQQQQNEDGAKALASVVYPIIDPETGRSPIYSNDAAYSRCKAELDKYGNDAGKVSIENSKACQAALAALKAKAATQAPTH